MTHLSGQMASLGFWGFDFQAGTTGPLILLGTQVEHNGELRGAKSHFSSLTQDEWVGRGWELGETSFRQKYSTLRYKKLFKYCELLQAETPLD